MPWVTTCTFREPVKSYYLDPGELELTVGMPVIAETARGLEIGRVKFKAREVPSDKFASEPNVVLRVADASDLAQDEDNRAFENRALLIARARVEAHRLDMKVVKCEILFDRSKLWVYYESEDRVDFRELLKDLGQKLGVRLHLQHVGPREAAKVLGGCGPCGQSLCCSTFLKETPAVNLKLAKEQRMSLTPSKISGACGRLMCCLRFEVEFYRDANQRLPKNGAHVDTPEGPGTVVEVNVFNETVYVRLGDGRHISVPGDTMRSLRDERGTPNACKNHISAGGSCTKGAKAADAMKKEAEQ